MVGVDLDGAAQVIARPIGQGRLVVVASDSVFTNAILPRRDNVDLAWSIFDQCLVDGPIVVDESASRGGGPAVLGLLFGPVLRPITLQLLILVWIEYVPLSYP